MTVYPSNALLASPENHIETSSHSLRLADDMKRGYSTTPTAHIRDLASDGIKPHGLAVYFAIADRQMTAKGEFFKSNKGLADDTGLSVSCVKKWLRILKQKGYLSVWYNNGNRRMRVSTGVLVGTPTKPQGYPQVSTDKENNIKKTTQPNVCVFSEKHLSLFGARFLDGLVSSHGSDRVMSGLQVYDQQPVGTVRNLKAWLTDACKIGYEPSKKTAGKFTQCPFEQTKIVKTFIEENPDKDGTIQGMISEGLSEGRIAYKIWLGKL